MKFFAIFAFVAVLAVAAAYPYEYEPEYEGEQYAEAEPAAELTRVARSYGGGGVKCGKAVVVSCAPQIQKVKCKGGKGY